MYRSLEEINAAAKQQHSVKIAVAAAADLDVLTAVNDAKLAGIADAILVGDVAEIRKNCEQLGINVNLFELENEPDPRLAARRAAALVKQGNAHVLMKGLVGTADFMRAVLDKTEGLGTGHLLSHVVAFEPAGYDRLLLLTDAAINIAPDLAQKVQIIENALQVSRALGNWETKVAMLAAVETVTASMKATEEAAMIAKMSERGQIKGCRIDGPLALDNAVSLAAAHHKGIGGAVAGQADLLVVPNIEAGNVLYKSLVYFANTPLAGIVVGAAAPVVLTSRADSPATKLNSIAMAVVVSGAVR
jgi:phosphate butyryltransferase